MYTDKHNEKDSRRPKCTARRFIWSKARDHRQNHGKLNLKAP
jgi:hypothetical protein